MDSQLSVVSRPMENLELAADSNNPNIFSSIDDDDDMRLFKSPRGPGLARKILCITMIPKSQISECIRLMIWARERVGA